MPSVLRVHGGKGKLAPKIVVEIERLRQKHGLLTYGEPMCFGASVFLGLKDPFPFEVINDINHHVYNWWWCLREKPEDLVRDLLLTPYSRREYQQLRVMREPNIMENMEPDVECARQFTVLSWFTLGGSQGQFRSATDWRRLLHMSIDGRYFSPAWEWKGLWVKLCQTAERLHGVQVDHQDVFDFIEDYDHEKALFYLDPPYLRLRKRTRETAPTAEETTSSRTGPKKYVEEWGPAKHVKLLEAFCSMKSAGILSSYPNEVYETHLGKCLKVDLSSRLHSTVRGTVQHTQTRVERLYIKPPGAITMAPRKGPQRRITDIPTEGPA